MKYVWYILVMAGTTYLIRMVPLVLFQRPIKSRFVKSFLFYVPYAVLGAMTFPAVFFSTGSLWSALAGTAVAVALAFRGCGLLPVALSACGAVFVVERLLALL